MLDLTPEQRQLLSDKLPDAANVVLGAVVLGPFLGQGRFSVARVVGGIALWLLAFGVCFYVGRRT
jgi:TM2 domain-containing membrane protein YozV